MSSVSVSMDRPVGKILVVDDDPMILSVLKEQLQPEGLEATFVDSASKALDALKRENFSIVVADHEMPGMTGLELLAKVKETHPELVRLMISGKLAVKDLLDAVHSGLIHRYITKPWLREELIVVLRNSVARKVSELDLTVTDGTTEPLQEAGEAPGAAEPAAGFSGAVGTPEQAKVAVEVFVKMLTAFHPNLGNTALRTMALCKTVASVIDLPPDAAQSLIWAGGLHDISMVGIERAAVRRWLRSSEKCTEEELSAIKKHPQKTEEMLQAYPIFQEASEIIRSHHENWDGTGYPDRLQGETIPWLSRLLAVSIYFCSRHQAPAQVMNDAQSQVNKMFDPQAFEVVAKAVPATELPRGEREILLIELQPGMVLAGDIYNTSGVLIIAKGKELTTAWINKIQNINSATPLNPHVLVYC
ncbi:MAG: response regulator [Verrucomicrobia bacterium]|nr:response regulator [Verrucomicrobiota bacterium]